MRRLVVFPSGLGWMGLVAFEGILQQLVFGHPSARAALAALAPELVGDLRPGDGHARLVSRLKAYAAGTRDDFLDVPVADWATSEFRRRVYQLCREIPYGETLTYGQLALLAGSPGAGRAVGCTMAANRIPLVIPCHRVVPAGGRLGGFSAPDGVRTKRRLLALEGRV